MLTALAAASAHARPQAEARTGAADVRSLRELTLEQLVEQEITSVSRRAEPLRGAAASIFVITNNDLRRAGVTSLPEALRLAPNLQVAYDDAQDYSITARGSGGFSDANKLLVLIDGRSVYSPIFSGVFWDALYLQLQDVDRIEVISGPGGTLYGANAVNGVINVVTRAAADTAGGYAGATVGNQDVIADARWGGTMGARGAYRVYASGWQRGPSRLSSGTSANDDFDGYSGGFRADWAGASDTLTLQGDAHDFLADDRRGDEGGNVLARWTRRVGGSSALEVQAYYDHVYRQAATAEDTLSTFDVRAQLTTTVWKRHTIVAGAGYRLYDDTWLSYPGTPFFFDPAMRESSLADVFVQDSIAVTDATVLTLGAKLEHNSYTDDLEPLPSVRAAWSVSEGSLIWGAVSRAIRSPSRFDRDLVLPGVIAPGGDGFTSEELIAYELGWRGTPAPYLSAAATLFLHDYDSLRTFELTSGGLPQRFRNNLEGENYGIEAWGTAQVAARWRLHLGGTVLQKDYRFEPGAEIPPGTAPDAGNDPDYQLFLRSQHELGADFDLDVRLRHVAELTEPGIEVPAYTEADLTLNWQAGPRLALTLAGFNLLDESHPEQRQGGEPIFENPRRYHLGARFRF